MSREKKKVRFFIGSSLRTFQMDAQVSHRCTNKVVFIMGATGTGKSRLSIDLATDFNGEIINSDKMQVYKGLDIVTNKVTEEEKKGIPHHLLGEFQPDSEFTAQDFCEHVISTLGGIFSRGRIPVIVGGSNSYLKTLMEDLKYEFKSKYDCLFIWLHVSEPVLNMYVSKRVDQMVNAGLVDEGRPFFDAETDHDRGIYRSIGVIEMASFYKDEVTMDKETKEMVLKKALQEIKDNTCQLTARQVAKIEQLKNEDGWPIHQIDATLVFEKCMDKTDEEWERVVKIPSSKIVTDFLSV